MNKRMLWMPDYYSSFSCKMGACRNACCTGWPVSFSLEDYFKLINEECSTDLRDRLDKGLKIALNPTPDRYAEIVPGYDQNCPMRLPDGRCAIHAELGEEALSNVCRLYPRGIRKEPDGYEVSCANSCEAVLELFLFRDAPLTFTVNECETVPPPLAERTFFFETYGHEREVRLSLIHTMQMRSMTLPERLVALEKRLVSGEAVMKSGNCDAVIRWLGDEPAAIHTLPEVSDERLEEGLFAMEKLIAVIDDHSNSIRTYGEKALNFFRGNEDPLALYSKAKHSFETEFPDRERFFEHMLVNHMFFSCFPFEDRPEDLRSEYMAICSVYSLLRFLAVGCSSMMKCKEDYIDLFASAFRLIDHTAFDIYISHVLNDLGWTTDGKILEWIIL